jgi:hypothetical protein
MKTLEIRKNSVKVKAIMVMLVAKYQDTTSNENLEQYAVDVDTESKK